MAPHSMDLRTRVLRDSDAGMCSKDVAVKYAVSRAWVDRLKQRRRETGQVTPRVQTVFRRRALTAAQEPRLGLLLLAVQPDATLAELQAALPRSLLKHAVRAIGRFGPTCKNGRRSTAASCCSRRLTPRSCNACSAGE